MNGVKNWRTLCGKAVALTGSQAAFQREARILQRLVRGYGPEEVDHMLDGAAILHWRNLRSLGSKDGAGRRWALEAYWQHVNHERPRERMESLATVLKARGLLG